MKSKLTEIIEGILKNKGFEVPEEKREKFDKIVSEAEKEFDRELEKLVNRALDVLDKIKLETGIDIKDMDSYAKEKMIKGLKDNLSKED